MLNISGWKQFQIKDIFEVKNGKGLTVDEINSNKGDIACVQGGESNNGSIGNISREYCEQKKYVVIDEPCLTVARVGTSGCVNYWDKSCAIGDKCKALLLKEHKSENAYLFMQTILNKLQYKYCYGRGLVTETYLNETIKLPIDSNGKPDWQFIDRFMNDIKLKNRGNGSILLNSTKTKNNEGETIKASDWSYFKLSDLFDIKYGINMELLNCEEENGTINFVARTGENNGVSAKVRLVDGKIPQESGLITVAGGGSVLSTFLQETPFYSGRDLYILKAKDEIDKYAKLFIITLIRREKFKYSYGRQANKTLPFIEIKLPVKNGKPDYDYMSQYMKSLPYADRI